MGWLSFLRGAYMLLPVAALTAWYLRVPPAAVLFACLYILALIGYVFMQCPGCGTHLARKRPGLFGHSVSAPPDCMKCGRSKSGVRPFQRLTAPEAR